MTTPLAPISDATPERSPSATPDALAGCDAETAESFGAAEALYAMTGEEDGKRFTRSAGFAYCFAVENEVRVRLGEKIRRVLGKGGQEKTLEALLDSSGHHFSRRVLSPFFQRSLILARKLGSVNPMEHASLENYLHVLARMDELGPKYRPDGLKAFGIILICLGTEIKLGGEGREEKILRACLKLSGEDEALRAIACELMKLGHLRNAYVHPESGEMRNINEIREIAGRCLKGIQAIT